MNWFDEASGWVLYVRKEDEMERLAQMSQPETEHRIDLGNGWYAQRSACRRTYALKASHSLERDTDIGALVASVERWNAIVQFHQRFPGVPLSSGGACTCALCVKYNTGAGGDCEGCPVYDYTGGRFCDNTPYGAYVKAEEGHLYHAQEMRDLLEMIMREMWHDANGYGVIFPPRVDLGDGWYAEYEKPGEYILRYDGDLACDTKLEAVEKSVEKWEKVVAWYDVAPVMSRLDCGSCWTCALCARYPLSCRNCPVLERTGFPGCSATPYVYYNCDPSLVYARDELDFLVSIRDEILTDTLLERAEEVADLARRIAGEE